MMTSRKYRLVLLLTLAVSTFACQRTDGMGEVVKEETLKTERPNIILIMVDDLGFSDLGCYGGEIETPNIDRLARKGVRFTQFYNCAKCENTRASLMSGQFHPEVGKTNLKNCLTIAEAMKLTGYQTMMTGKWHLKSDPVSRGFDRYFGHLSGATNFFTGDDTFRLGQEPFQVPKEGFYTTDANTDYAIKFLKERDAQSPFFLYIAHNAPHYPLQAPKEDVLKYRGKYTKGWDEVRKERFQRQLKMGLFPASTKPADRPADVPAWDSLSSDEQDMQELMMATFAAMVDRVDQNMGRLIDYLKSEGLFDNTLILFLSDNGACPFQRTKPETKKKKLKPWDPNSYWVYDKGWAHACNTPFREYKQNQHEGGICTPMIAHWKQGITEPGRLERTPNHLVDIMPTMLELGNGKYPEEFQGKPIPNHRGRSFAPSLNNKTPAQRSNLYFSFRGKNNALRVGDWKLVNKGFQKFELFNISQDRTEQNDLSKSEPEKFREMLGVWKSFSKQVGQTHKPKKRKPKK